MPSDLQRVATALVECLDQMPNLVAHLQRLAVRFDDGSQTPHPPAL